MRFRSLSTGLACLALFAACAAGRDVRDDDPPPAKDAGIADGGTEDAGAADAGETTDGGLVCPPHFADCNLIEADGCEADLWTSNTHCGGCNQPCSGTCTSTGCQIGSPAVQLCVYEGPTLLDCAIPPSVLAVDFGTPASGTLAQRTLEIRAAGSAPLDIAGPSFTGHQDFSATPNPFSAHLVNGEKSELTLSFGPLSTGPRSATMTLSSNIPTAPTITVELTGGPPPGNCVLQTDSSLNFGSVNVLTSTTKTVTLTNAGTADCLIETMPSFVNGVGGLFEITSVSLPLTVAPGNTTSFTLKYTPQDSSSPDTATLRTVYSALGGPQKQVDVSLTGTAVVAQECILTATPAAGAGSFRVLEFGSVARNTTSTMAVTFTNAGGVNCTISNPRFLTSFLGSSAGFTLGSTGTQTVLPGSSATYSVNFTPTSLSGYGSAVNDSFYNVLLAVDVSDTKRFPSSDCYAWPSTSGPAGCVAWGLHGTGVNSPTVSALPNSVSFGQTQTGCRSATTNVSLAANNGAVNVTSVRIDPTSTVFSVVSPPTTPFTIAAGSTKPIGVRFAPSSVSSYSSNLVVETSAGNLTIPLTGSGTSSTTATETFSAAANVDVLLVVDDSGSMSEEQSALSGAATPFINAATSRSADYQISVVTTDMVAAAKSGNFQGSPKIVKPGASATSQLSATIQALGTNGDSTEKGLDAMRTALSTPLISDSSKNGGFLRSSADLAVVIVSDEDDYSSDTAATYTQFLSLLKGNRKAVLHAIVGDSPSGCSGTGGSADAATRYLEVQSATGGLFRSICSSSWTQPVTDIAQSIFAVPRTFYLTRPATAGSFTVKVNNVTVSSSTYTFDSTANAITFNVASAPASGAAISIAYSAVCLP